MVAIFGLLTDFGERDPYRGQLASVLLRRCPSCQLIDLSHRVDPHNILQGAFFLRASWPYLPEGCVVVAVVDPGVGGSRDIVLLRSGEGYVLAPDNGLLELMFRHARLDGLWRLSTERYPWRSATFHGRDVFAPLAADLVTCRNPDGLGTRLSVRDMVRLQYGEAEFEGDYLVVHVLHVDRFGNCVLNIPEDSREKELLESGGAKMMEPESVFVPAVAAYCDIPAGRPGLLPGSQGYLELATDRESCAELLGLGNGDRCLFCLP
ncbi:MAG: SAM-dependent chlorinase/fluorinase [Desulfohalobiaceae bacterium]|nr:SAM-dependent chlorinase/fluorinase [Desulfohalobiaceae bacterium]